MIAAKTNETYRNRAQSSHALIPTLSSRVTGITLSVVRYEKRRALTCSDTRLMSASVKVHLPTIVLWDYFTLSLQLRESHCRQLARSSSGAKWWKYAVNICFDKLECRMFRVPSPQEEISLTPVEGIDRILESTDVYQFTRSGSVTFCHLLKVIHTYSP
jgi:hypothetical protein